MNAYHLSVAIVTDTMVTCFVVCILTKVISLNFLQILLLSTLFRLCIFQLPTNTYVVGKYY